MDIFWILLCSLLRRSRAANLPPTEPVLFWNFASAKKGSNKIATHSTINGDSHDMELKDTAHITSEGLDCNDGYANTEFYYISSSVFSGFGVKPHSIEAKLKYSTLSQSGISPISLYIDISSTPNIIDYFDAIMLYDKKYIAGSEAFNRTKIPMTGDGAIAETLVNEWIHLVITYDPDINSVTLYRNGEQYGDSFSAEFMSFYGTMGVLVCTPYFGVDSLQGVIAAVAVYDQVLDASTIEAHYKYYMKKTNKSNIDWLSIIVWFLAILIVIAIAIFVACKYNKRRVYAEKSHSFLQHAKTYKEEGIKMQVDVTTDDEVNVDSNYKSEVFSPPEAFVAKSKSSPQQNESPSSHKIPDDTYAKHVQEVKIIDEDPKNLGDGSLEKNITEEKAEEITDEKGIKEDTISGMTAIGNMISLIKVDGSIISPTEMTPRTAETLSYPTPLTAKSVTSISEAQSQQEYKPVVLDENVENV